MRLRLSTSLIATSLCLSAGFAIAPPGALADSGSVTLNQTETRKTLFVAGQVDRLADLDVDGKIATAIDLLGWEVYRQNPELSVSTARTGMEFVEEAVRLHFEGTDKDIRDRFLTQATELEILEVLRDATQGMNYFEPAARAMVQDALVQENFDNAIGEYGLNVTGDQGDAMRDVVLDPRKVLGQVFDEALVNPRYGDFRDTMFGAKDGVSVKDTAAEMLAKDPDLKNQPLLKDAVKADGTLTISKDTAKGAANQTVDKANAETAETIDATGRMVKAGERMRAARTDAERKQAEVDFKAAQAELKSEKEAREKLLKDSKIALTGLTMIIEQFDPEAAEAIEEVGTTILKGAQLFHQFANTASSVATNLATGNYVGVVMDVFSLVSGMGDMMKTPEQQATEKLKQQIDKLGENLAKFRSEMNARLDRIDGALNTIYLDLNTNFAELKGMVGKVGQDVNRVMDDVVKNQARLDQVGARVYSTMSDAANRDLWVNVNTAIGWRERSPGGKPMPDSKFVEYAGLFQTWATNSAYDAAALPTGRSFDDQDLQSELAFPLERNTEFLRSYPQTRFGFQPFDGKQLPNPKDWAVAARAYSQLLLENPEYMTPGLDAWITQVQDGGKRLQAAIRKVGTADTAEGTKSRLLNRLLANVREKTADVGTRIEAIEADYRSGLKAADGTPLRLDLYAGPDQTPDAQPTITEADGMALPANGTMDALVPKAVLNAIRFAGGELRPSFSAEWVGKRDGEPARNGNVNTYARLSATLTWKWNKPGTGWVTVGTKSHTFGEEILCQTQYDRWDGTFVSTTCPGDAALTALRSGWNHASRKGQFEASATGGTDADTHAAARKVASDHLVARQTGMYERVAADMRNGGTDVSRSLVRLNGATALIRQYVQLGLPAGYEANAELRALLTGNERLLDQDADRRFEVLYTQATLTPPPGNFRAVVLGEAEQRAAALAGLLAGEVKAAAPAARAAGDGVAAPSGSALIDTTMARLSLTRFVLTGPKGTVPPKDGPAGEQPKDEQPRTPAPGVTPPAAPAPQTPALPTPPRGGTAPSTSTTARTASVQVVSVAARRTGATIKVRTSAPGTVVVKVLSGKKVVATVTGKAAKAGTLTLKARFKVRPGAKLTVRATQGAASASKATQVKR